MTAGGQKARIDLCPEILFDINWLWYSRLFRVPRVV